MRMRLVTPRTIIVVDDDPLFGTLLARALAPEVTPDVHVVVETTAEGALARIAQLDHMAIIVADHDLGSRMSGVELLRHAHEHEPMHQRILMTGSRPADMPEATYPIVMEAFEKPTWLDANQPLLRCVIDRCRAAPPPAPPLLRARRGEVAARVAGELRAESPKGEKPPVGIEPTTPRLQGESSTD